MTGLIHRRTAGVGEDDARRRLAKLAGGISIAGSNSRVRRLLDEGRRLGLMPGDSVRIATAMLRALDEHGEFRPAIEELIESFEAGELTTEFREPLNRFVTRPAVAALAVTTCAHCRPKIPVRDDEALSVLRTEPAPVDTRESAAETPQSALLIADVDPVADGPDWPDRTTDGEPQIVLDVLAWWPELAEWEKATLTATIKKSLAFSGDNFILSIEQEDDESPAIPKAVWLVRRDDLDVGLPAFELRASTWEPGDAAPYRYRFLLATSSHWCDELHDYLATRWIGHGESPGGPDEFATPLPADPPRIRAAAGAGGPA